jgi:hypothetical protein
MSDSRYAATLRYTVLRTALVKLLAIRLGCQKTPAKSLVIRANGKYLEDHVEQSHRKNQNRRSRRRCPAKTRWLLPVGSTSRRKNLGWLLGIPRRQNRTRRNPSPCAGARVARGAGHHSSNRISVAHSCVHLSARDRAAEFFSRHCMERRVTSA